MAQKKGQMGLQNLPNLAIMFVIVAVTFVLGVSLVSTFGASAAKGSVEQNVTNQTLQGMTNITSQIPTLGTILIFAIIIAALIGGFMIYRNKK